MFISAITLRNLSLRRPERFPRLERFIGLLKPTKKISTRFSMKQIFLGIHSRRIRTRCSIFLIHIFYHPTWKPINLQLMTKTTSHVSESKDSFLLSRGIFLFLWIWFEGCKNTCAKKSMDGTISKKGCLIWKVFWNVINIRRYSN